MPRANPLFDPNWQTAYRAAAVEHARLAALCDALGAENFGGKAHRAALDAREAARARIKNLDMARHPTIAAYAAWRFSSLPAGDGAGIVPDPEAFSAIEEVDRAHARIKKQREEGGLLDGLLLPTRQPPGLAAFAEPARLICSSRRFAPDEINDQPPLSPEPHVDCLVAFEEHEQKFNFCLGHRWGELSARANEHFRNIATVLARQAAEFAIPGANILFVDENHRRAAHRDLIREVNALVSRCIFYRHLWPHRGMKESFGRVDMSWNGARFFDPDWSAALFSSLPPALRDARPAQS